MTAKTKPLVACVGAVENANTFVLVTVVANGTLLDRRTVLPDSIEARIRDNRAQSMADSVMYRQALAKAAEERGWRVYWYDRDQVRNEVEAFAEGDLVTRLQAMGEAAGSNWQAKHQLAAAASLAALGSERQ